TNQTCPENRNHLERAGKMIRADVKSAGPSAVIDSLQEFNQHEIVAVAKLNRTDEHMNEGKREKRNNNPSPRFCRRANQRDEPINDQSADDRVNIRTRGIDDLRKKCANQYVSKKDRASDDADVRWSRSGLPQ